MRSSQHCGTCAMDATQASPEESYSPFNAGMPAQMRLAFYFCKTGSDSRTAFLCRSTLARDKPWSVACQCGRYGLSHP